MDITLVVDSIQVDGTGRGKLSVTLSDVDLAAIVKECGSADLLDEIGKKEAMSHFDLVEEEV